MILHFSQGPNLRGHWQRDEAEQSACSGAGWSAGNWWTPEYSLPPWGGLQRSRCGSEKGSHRWCLSGTLYLAVTCWLCISFVISLLPYLLPNLHVYFQKCILLFPIPLKFSKIGYQRSRWSGMQGLWKSVIFSQSPYVDMFYFIAVHIKVILLKIETEN